MTLEIIVLITVIIATLALIYHLSEISGKLTDGFKLMHEIGNALLDEFGADKVDGKPSENVNWVADVHYDDEKRLSDSEEYHLLMQDDAPLDIDFLRSFMISKGPQYSALEHPEFRQLEWINRAERISLYNDVSATITTRGQMRLLCEALKIKSDVPRRLSRKTND